MRKKVIERFSFVLILLLFLLPGVFAVSLGNCEVVTRTECDDTTTEGYIIMGLSSLTNSHGYLPSSITSTYVLCCNFGTGMSTCTGTNGIVNLFSPTDSHAESPSETLYKNPVCYENIECGLRDVCLADEKGVLALSSSTNAHLSNATGVGSFPKKVCCSQSSMAGYVCELSSVEWSAKSAPTGSEVSLIVNGNGAQCNGKSVYFDVNKAKTQPVSVKFEGDTAKGTWKVEGETGDNYYFKSSLKADLSNSKQSANLKVLTEFFCSDVISCDDYPKENCEDKKADGTDLCGVAVKTMGEDFCSQNGVSCYCKLKDDKCVPAWENDGLGTCGDGIIDPNGNNNGIKEQCDPDSGVDVFSSIDTCVELSAPPLSMDTYTGGKPKCSNGGVYGACQFDTSTCTSASVPRCGDGVINQASEACDGSSLGGESCKTLGCPYGTLSCYAPGTMVNGVDRGCQLNKGSCESCDSHKICGDGVVELNDGNFAEQCDPSDAPGKSGVINLNGKSCSSFTGFSGSPLLCKSDCTFDYAGCTGTKLCEDGIVDMLGEECDGTDFQGISCKYLGFTEGNLVCSRCKIDSSSTCSGGEAGTCLQETEVQTSCETGEGKKTVVIKGTWIGEKSGQDYTDCITPITKVYPCPAQVQLPFFDYMQMIAAVLVIAIIYAFSLAKKRSK